MIPHRPGRVRVLGGVSGWPRLSAGRGVRVCGVAAAVACFATVPTASWGSAPRNGPIAYAFEEQLDGPCPDCDEDIERLPRSWIEQVLPRGGPHTRLPCTTGAFASCRDSLPAYSRNGKRLAIVNSSEIVITRTNGEVLHRIPVAAATLAWSPDGRRLAYTRRYTGPPAPVRHAVFVTTLGGAATPVVTARNVDPFGLSWSPRGLLAWERISGRRGVYVSGPAGQNPRRILPARDLPRLPRWSYDGRRLAYACGPTLAALCTARPDGSRRQLLTRRCEMEFEPGGSMAWSPDGRYVACQSRTWGDLITVRLRDDKQRIVRRRPDSANFLPVNITWRALSGPRP